MLNINPVHKDSPVAHIHLYIILMHQAMEILLQISQIHQQSALPLLQFLQSRPHQHIFL